MSNTSSTAALHAPTPHATLPGSDAGAGGGGRKPGKSGQAPAAFAQLLGNAAESELQRRATIPTPAAAAGSAAQLQSRPNRSASGEMPRGEFAAPTSAPAKAAVQSRTATHEYEQEVPPSMHGHAPMAAEATGAKEPQADARPDRGDSAHDSESSAREGRVEASGANRLAKPELGASTGLLSPRAKPEGAEDTSLPQTEIRSPSRPSAFRAADHQKVDAQSGTATLEVACRPGDVAPAGTPTSKISRLAQARFAQLPIEPRQAEAATRPERQYGVRRPENSSHAQMPFNETSAVQAPTFHAEARRGMERASATAHLPLTVHAGQPSRTHSVDGTVPLNTQARAPKVGQTADADRGRSGIAAQLEEPALPEATPRHASRPQARSEVAKSTPLPASRTGRQAPPHAPTSSEASAIASAHHAGSFVPPSADTSVRPAETAASPEVAGAATDEHAAKDHASASELSHFSATTFPLPEPVATASRPSLRAPARRADPPAGQHDHSMPLIAADQTAAQAPSLHTRGPRPGAANTPQGPITAPHTSTRIVPPAPSTQAQASTVEGAAPAQPSQAASQPVRPAAMGHSRDPGEQPRVGAPLTVPLSARPQAGEARTPASAPQAEPHRAAPPPSTRPADSAAPARLARPQMSPPATASSPERTPQISREPLSDSARAPSDATAFAPPSPPPASRQTSAKPRSNNRLKPATAHRTEGSPPATEARTPSRPRAEAAATSSPKTGPSAPQPQPNPAEVPAPPETVRTPAEIGRRPAQAQPADAESTTRAPSHRSIRSHEQLPTATKPQAQPAYVATVDPNEAPRAPAPTEQRENPRTASASQRQPLAAVDAVAAPPSLPNLDALRAPEGPGHASPIQLSPGAPVATSLPPVPVPLMALPQGSATLTDPSTIGAYNPAPVTLDSAPLYERAAGDPGLAVTVLPHAAHLSLAADEGDLSLHVRVRDGSADVNVSGSMAPIFESKAPEVRTVLATQGFGLGSFATDHQGGGHNSQQRPEAPPTAAQSPGAHQPAARASTAIGSDTVDEGRIHITA